MLQADTNMNILTTPSPSTEHAELNLKRRMQLAINAVMHKGETPTCAARKWKLNRLAILKNLLREKKCQQEHGNNMNGECHAASAKLFQSKFTSNQLLSARQEESLANYLKQCYEMQWQHNSIESTSIVSQQITLKKPPLLSEEVARSFTHNYVHMHKLKYPSSWDVKQQAAPDWFNGFVDRNPEVIEFVTLSTKKRKQRKRTFKLEACAARQSVEVHSCAGNLQKEPMWLNEQDVIERDNENFGHWSTPVSDIGHENKLSHKKTQSSSQSSIEIKIEPTDIDEVDMIPEVVYQANQFSPQVANSQHLPSETIAESVKRRTLRKPRIFAEHLYAAERTMESEKMSSYARQRHPIKIQKQQTYHEKSHYDNEEHYLVKHHQRKEPSKEKPTHCSQSQSLDNLKKSIEKMHADMNYLMQSMLMEMTENNRLLRRLITTNENKR